MASEQLSQLRQEMAQLRQFHVLAKSIVKNSKGEVLLTALRRAFATAAQAQQSQRVATLQWMKRPPAMAVGLTPR